MHHIPASARGSKPQGYLGCKDMSLGSTEYRGTSLIRNCPPWDNYRALGTAGFWGGGLSCKRDACRGARGISLIRPSPPHPKDHHRALGTAPL